MLISRRLLCLFTFSSCFLPFLACPVIFSQLKVLTGCQRLLNVTKQYKHPAYLQSPVASGRIWTVCAASEEYLHALQHNDRLNTVPDRVLQNQDLWRTATAKSTHWPSWLAEAACTQACVT